MDGQKHINFKISLKNTYKKFKEAILLFYNYTNNENTNEPQLNFTLFKSKINKNFSCAAAKVLDTDGATTFSICRYFAENFNGIINIPNFDKFAKKTSIQSTEVNYNKVEWYTYWDNLTFTTWLDTISNNVIQFDEFDNEIIYFIEVPNLDLVYTNNELKRLDIDLEFYNYNYSYSTKDNNKICKESPIEPFLNELFTKIDINNFILDSMKRIKEDNLDYFIILGCKQQSELKLDQAGFFHFPALLQGHYRRNNEKWLYIVAGSLEFPDEKLLAKTKCVIIPGSHLKAYEDLEFLTKAKEWIIYFHNNFPKVKYLGLCFGAQFLFHSLEGGKCEQSKTDRFNNFSKLKFLDFTALHIVAKTETLEIADNFWDIPFVKLSEVKPVKRLKIHQFHGDEITKFGKEFKLYASSESCKNEILVSLDNRYFCIQGHAEYQRDFVVNRICGLIAKSKTKSYSSFLPEEILKTQNDIRDEILTLLDVENNFEFRSLCFSFLKN